MNKKDCQTELTAALIAASQDHAELLADYRELSLRSELTERDAIRLDQIYAEAEEHPMLSFLITELDHSLNYQLGLLSEDSVESYKNQQAWLRERLEQSPFEHDYRQEIQKMLADAGFYEGPIDGVIGRRSTQAIKEMTTQMQTLLSKRGFYKKNIDGEFGKFSSKATKDFQREKLLEDSGVPNRETLLALQSE